MTSWLRDQPSGARKAVADSPSKELLSPLALGTFAVALAVRLIHIWQIRSAPFFSILIGDGRGYDSWAQRIAGGDWVGSEVFYQAPLYPYFLGVIYAVAGHSLLIVRVCQAVVGAAACALLALAVRRLFSEREGMIAGLALALYAPAIFFDGLIQKSVLDVFLICLMLWISAGIIQHSTQSSVSSDVVSGFSRTRSWLTLGLATGALALTRENALVFVLVILGWAFFGTWGRVRLKADTTDKGKVRQKKVRLKADTTSGNATSGSDATSASDATYRSGAAQRSASFLLGLALVLLPVAVRNYAVGGGFYLTTSQFGPNFYIGNNPLAEGTYRSLRPWRGSPEVERLDATELAEAATGRKLTPGEVSTYWTDRALTFITSQPGAWLTLMGRKLALLVNASEMIDTESQESYAEWSWPVWLGSWIGHFGVLVPLALLGAWMVWPERQRLSLFYAMTLVYSASLIVFYVFARYRYPLVPLLLLFVAPAIRAAPTFVQSASRGQKLGVGAALLVAIVATNWPLVPFGFPQAVTENNLGIALQADGRFDEAAGHFQRAIAARDDFAPAHNNLGLALRAQGRSDEAMSAFERAIATRPGYADSYFNLGVELQSRGEHAKAIERFREFSRRNQDEANVVPANNRIAASLFAQGRLEEAAATFRFSLGKEPGDADALSGLADLLFKQGRFEEAARRYSEYVRRVPGNATAFHNLGLALVRQDKEQEAVDAFARAVSLQPRNPAFHEDLGNALGSVGRLDEAVASYRRAVELAPANVKIRNSLGLALAAQGKMQEALAEFQRSLELEPNNPQTRIDLETARRMRP